MTGDPRTVAVRLDEALRERIGAAAMRAVIIRGGPSEVADAVLAVLAEGEANANGKVLIDRQRLANAIIYHYGQNGRGQCSGGCDVRLGSSLAEHVIDVALGDGEVVPERWRS